MVRISVICIAVVKLNYFNVIVSLLALFPGFTIVYSFRSLTEVHGEELICSSWVLAISTVHNSYWTQNVHVRKAIPGLLKICWKEKQQFIIIHSGPILNAPIYSLSLNQLHTWIIHNIFIPIACN